MAIYSNKGAKSWSSAHVPNLSSIQNFHSSLPNFTSTPLIPLPDLAQLLGVKHIFLKDESNRLGLPAFKILGASWGVFRAIAAEADLSLNSISLSDVSHAARQQGMSFFAATDGNHGRAVARMATLLGVDAYIFVPRFVDEGTRERIASEGQGVIVSVVEGDYDATVLEAARRADATDGGCLVQDTSFDGYEDVPQWIVEGYSTLLVEVEEQLGALGLKATIVVTPVGVGSLAQAVVSFCKSSHQGTGIAVLAVEPETAACLHESLKAGSRTAVSTSSTICDGMNCGTVSTIAWPTLRAGVDASITVSDQETHNAVEKLASRGVNVGPCGAATLAGLVSVSRHNPDAIGLDKDSVVVLLCTEGARPYVLPGR